MRRSPLPRTRSALLATAALAIVALAAGGCAHGPAPGGAPSAVAAQQGAQAAAVDAAMQHYVALLRRVASDSVSAMFTPDGELLEPGMAPLRGPAAIRAFLAPFDGHAHVDTATAVTLPAAVYGGVAYQWGTYHQVARLDAGAAGTFDGRFAAEWHREADGAWRLRRLLRQPAPPSASAAP